MKTAVLIAVMSIVTILLRALPFLVFRKRTPKYVTYLGRVLPPAMIGLLVVYCLKDIRFDDGTALASAIALVVCVVSYVIKRNTLISIVIPTILYMVLIRVL